MLNSLLKKIMFAFGLCFLMCSPGMGQETHQKLIHYLSGTDAENTMPWDFWVSGGRKSGSWHKINVPSHWDQQGFGNYNFGRDNVTNGKNFHFSDEKGFYKLQFTVPENFRENAVFLVFEGSMTDTVVKINGQLAGPPHRGGL